MSDTRLIANFVDGSDVEVTLVFDERRVQVVAYDEKTRSRYELTFARCAHISLAYADLADDYPNLSNFTEGVSEGQVDEQGFRHFTLGFADDTIMLIACMHFSMQPLLGGPWTPEDEE